MIETFIFDRLWTWFCFYNRFLVDYNYIRTMCFLTNDRESLKRPLFFMVKNAHCKGDYKQGNTDGTEVQM